MKLSGFNNLKDFKLSLIFIMLALNGCVFRAWIPNKETSYIGRNIDEVSVELENHGMKCFHSNLVITRLNAKKTVIDSERKVLNCNILQKKIICPIRHSLKIDYSIIQRVVVSKPIYSEAKQCF